MVSNEAVPSKHKKKRKDKKDRWARTEDAYQDAEVRAGSKKSKKSKKGSVATESIASSRESTNFPEDAEGGLYGDTPPAKSNQQSNSDRTGDDVFAHQF